MLITIESDDYYQVLNELRKARKELDNQLRHQVTWGVDWGKKQELTVVCIMKHYPDSTKEIVAIETEPRK